jgi:hypothetical protein
MGFTITVPAPGSAGGDYELPPEGIHRCVCVGLLDLGMIRSDFDDKEETNPQIAMVFELADESDREGQPLVIIKSYTRSFHEKAKLRQHMESWAGKRLEEKTDVDLRGVLGKSCQVTLKHDKTRGGKDVYKVMTIVPLGKGQASAPAKRPTFTWDWEVNPISAIPDWCPYLFGKSIADYIEKGRPKKDGTTNGNGKHDPTPPVPSQFVEVNQDAEDLPF